MAGRCIVARIAALLATLLVRFLPLLALARFLLAQLAAAARLAKQRLAQRCGTTTLSRVAARLSALDHGGPINMTQSELAQWVGATRESTARSLGELRRAGAVVTGRGRIEVVDRDQLVAAAG